MSSFGTNLFLERRILITKQFAEQQSVALGGTQRDSVSMQGKSSSHEMDRDIIRMQDWPFKREKQDALCCELEESPKTMLDGVLEIHDDFLSDRHQVEDVEICDDQVEETCLDNSSEENVMMNEGLKAVASRTSNDEQSAARNKQMAPAKICLKKSGNKQVARNNSRV